MHKDQLPSGVSRKIKNPGLFQAIHAALRCDSAVPPTRVTPSPPRRGAQNWFVCDRRSAAPDASTKPLALWRPTTNSSVRDMSLAPRDLLLTVLGVFALLFVVSALVRRFAADRMAHLRKPTGMFATFAVLACLLFAARALDAPVFVRWLGVAYRIVGGLTIVSLVALALLDVLMRVFGRVVPTIVVDLASAAGYIVVVAVAFAESGINPTSAIAGTTVVAAVLTVSLQSTLGNVVGGVALQLDGSIEVGDWIQLDSARLGRVAAIRWRHVVLETRDGDAIVVPNSLLLAQPFTVLGKRAGALHPHRQIIYFRVDYRYRPSRVCDVVERAILASPIDDVAAVPPASVVCAELSRGGDSSALYAVRYWLEDLAVDMVADSDVRARVYAALRRAGIPLALPSLANLNTQADDDATKLLRQTERAFVALRSLDLFSSLNDEECLRLAEGVIYCPFAPGEIITRQGAVAQFLYLMTSGSVEVSAALDANETRVWELAAPTFFGEMGLLTGETRRASVIAREAVECFKLERAGLEEVIRKRPEVANELGEALAHRQAQLDAAVVDAEARVAVTSGASLGEAIRRFFRV